MTPPAVEVVDRTRHHIALRLLPFLFLLYIVNYVDRTNLAYAALGMSRDLGFSDEVFGLGAGIFFVTYTAMQVPGALLVGCGRGGLFPRRHCLSEPLVQPRGPRQSDQQFHGCHSAFVRARIALRRLDSR